MISEENLAQLRALIEAILDERGIRKPRGKSAERQHRYRQRMKASVTKRNARRNEKRNASRGESVTKRNGHDNGASLTKEKFELPEWLLPDRDVWDAWIEARTKIKKPPTDWALSRAVAKLERLKEEGHVPRRLLADAAFHNWQSFYPLKD